MPNEEYEDLGRTPNGAHLYRKPNDAGGHIYISDEIMCGVVVWDTSCVNEGTLLAAMACERQRKHMEQLKQEGCRPPSGGSFIDGFDNTPPSGAIRPKRRNHKRVYPDGHSMDDRGDF